MELSWEEYKALVEGFLQKIFNNCISLESYEKKFGVPNTFLYNAIEDNFYVKYICKSLNGELLKWQKKYYGVKDHKKYGRCKECGKLIEKTGNKKTYCEECAQKRKKTSNKKSDKKYKNKKRENRNLIK